MKQRFVPKNPLKYKGNTNNIIARSSWEYVYMKWLDESNFIKSWQSEPKHLNLQYYNPVKGKVCKYWPDFLIEYIDGSIKMIEIKPLSQTIIKEKSTRYDKIMIAQNHAKWQVANEFCKKYNLKFEILTENQLFKKK